MEYHVEEERVTEVELEIAIRLPTDSQSSLPVRR